LLLADSVLIPFALQHKWIETLTGAEMDDKRQLVCPQCAAINGVPFCRLDGKPNCGKCHQPLFQQKSILLNSGNFQRHIARNDIPVLVKFWAEWCGYCRKMAPAFELAAGQLEPYVRLAKLNTETNSAIASQYTVSSLPTVILFRAGQEIARQAGALTVEQLVAWTRAKILP
jgi:thioredoxin 2